MTEYWVSKKQYWCKYCNIWIRDDAPHETGLKHQGQKERFIRDLYKGGVQAKAEKAQQAIEIARIESRAANAHARDTNLSATHGRPSALLALQAAKAAASTSRKISERKDKWADYSTAKQLGFDDEDTQKTSYEIEQQLKGRASNHVGAWEEVVEESHGLYTPPVDPSEEAEGSGGKRKLGEYGAGVVEEEDHEEFKFERKGKRPVRDVYEEDDWDPKAAFKGLKKKGEGSRAGTPKAETKSELEVKDEVGGLNRDGWTGKLQLQPTGDGQVAEGLTYEQGGGWVKAEEGAEEAKPEPATLPPQSNGHEPEDVKPHVEVDQKLVLEAAPPVVAADDSVAAAAPVDESPAAGGGLFKKRRPPPSSRKK